MTQHSTQYLLFTVTYLFLRTGVHVFVRFRLPSSEPSHHAHSRNIMLLKIGNYSPLHSQKNHVRATGISLPWLCCAYTRLNASNKVLGVLKYHGKCVRCQPALAYCSFERRERPSGDPSTTDSSKAIPGEKHFRNCQRPGEYQVRYCTATQRAVTSIAATKARSTVSRGVTYATGGYAIPAKTHWDVAHAQ